jgi:hypothetical protein
MPFKTVEMSRILTVVQYQYLHGPRYRCRIAVRRRELLAHADILCMDTGMILLMSIFWKTIVGGETIFRCQFF